MALKAVTLLHTSFYCKNASGVAILEVVHCSFDECLRRISQDLHELHRKVSHLLSCDVKDAMIVKTEKTRELTQSERAPLGGGHVTMTLTFDILTPKSIGVFLSLSSICV